MVRWSAGTRFGTDASLAGENSSVAISSTNEAKTQAEHRVDERQGGDDAARARVVTTMTCLRSKRSMSTPAPAAKKKPGTIRAAMTRPTDAPGAAGADAAAAEHDDGEEAEPVAERW